MRKRQMMKQLLLALLGLAVLGCGSKDPQPVTSPGSAQPESTSGGEFSDGGRCMPDGPGYEVSEYDTSGDTTPDVESSSRPWARAAFRAWFWCAARRI